MNKKKTALIIGIASQDGYYLSNLLLEKGYEVHGTTRRVLPEINNVSIHYLDLEFPRSFGYILDAVKPDEIYNLAALSRVSESFIQPELVSVVNGLSVLRFLEQIRSKCPDCKFYQSSTSELFGNPIISPQKENTQFHPRSPYAVSKLYAHAMTGNYREAYNLHTSCGILYNHCSPKRKDNFVSKKISSSIAKIKLGLMDRMSLGNMYSKRDWGYAPEFVNAMWLMLQEDQGSDYIVATGETYSIKDYVIQSFRCAGMELDWDGEGEDEIGLSNGKIVVDIDSKYYRPSDVDHMKGDYTKAKDALGWEPKVRFNELVEIMYKADFDRLK